MLVNLIFNQDSFINAGEPIKFLIIDHLLIFHRILSSRISPVVFHSLHA